MATCLYLFLIGHSYGSKYFAQALAHITAREDVWLNTGGEITDWYVQHYLRPS